MRIAAIAVLAVLSAASAAAQYGPVFNFSGYQWVPKVSTGKVGPGPNFFSAGNVSVDTQGRLHLKITKVGGKWQCSEVVMQGTLGYGTYRFYLDSPVDALDPSVVLGLFTWNDAADFNNREMDIEFAKWGVPKNNNGWYTVQPYDVAGDQVSFRQPANTPQSIQIFDWVADSAGNNRTATFSSVAGVSPASPPYAQRLFTSGVPPSGGENLRINLWLFQGRAPKAPVEIIVNHIEFIPSP